MVRNGRLLSAFDNQFFRSNVLKDILCTMCCLNVLDCANAKEIPMWLLVLRVALLFLGAYFTLLHHPVLGEVLRHYVTADSASQYRLVVVTGVLLAVWGVIDVVLTYLYLQKDD